MNTAATVPADDDEAPGRTAAPLRPLTEKQRRFVEEYLVEPNATQAAIRAGFSERSAHQIGHEQLRVPQVAAAIVAAMEARSRRTKVDQDWVLSKLREMFEADAADLYDRNGQLLPVKDWPKIWRTGLISGVDSVETIDLADEPDAATGKRRARRTLVMNKKVRWADKVKLLELIGKHVDVGAFREVLSRTLLQGAPEDTPQITNAAEAKVTFYMPKNGRD